MAVLLVASVGTGVGVGQAAENSLPDSPLYPVKTAGDWLRLVATRDQAARVGVYADQIVQRGRELQRAVEEDRSRAVVEVVALRLADSIERMVSQALELKARGRPEPAARAQQALQAMQQRLERLAPRAAPETGETLRRLHAFLDQQERRLERPGSGA